MHLAAGEWTRARTIAYELLSEPHRGQLRAETLLLLAEFKHDDLAVPVLEEALREAAGHPLLEARTHFALASARRFRVGFAAALDQIRSALDLSDDIDDGLRFRALSQLVVLAGMVGDPERPTYASRARQLALDVGDAQFLREANQRLSSVLFGSDPAAARALLARELRAWEDRDELVGAELRTSLAWLELATGHWELAADHAARARDISLQYGVDRNQDYISSSFIALHRGQLDRALEEAGRGLELSDLQIGFHPPLLKAVPGLVAFWRGDPATAVELLHEADRQAKALGWGSPDARRWTDDYVEALLAIGRIEDGRRVLDAWEADAMRLGSARVLASVTRCRGMVGAAEGDVEGAASLLERAAEEHAAVGDPFGRARAQLFLGIVRRRARQKRLAREAIAEALAGFEELGAATWIEKARAELGSIAGRRRADGLTAAERRVAALVAEGRTNREVAAALFLAERTVAGHLTRVYTKLGVRSRAELVRRMS